MKLYNICIILALVIRSPAHPYTPYRENPMTSYNRATQNTMFDLRRYADLPLIGDIMTALGIAVAEDAAEAVALTAEALGAASHPQPFLAVPPAPVHVVPFISPYEPLSFSAPAPFIPPVVPPHDIIPRTKDIDSSAPMVHTDDKSVLENDVYSIDLNAASASLENALVNLAASVPANIAATTVAASERTQTPHDSLPYNNPDNNRSIPPSESPPSIRGPPVAPPDNDGDTLRNDSPPPDAADPNNDGSTPPSASPPDIVGPPDAPHDNDRDTSRNESPPPDAANPDIDGSTPHSSSLPDIGGPPDTPPDNDRATPRNKSPPLDAANSDNDENTPPSESSPDIVGPPDAPHGNDGDTSRNESPSPDASNPDNDESTPPSASPLDIGGLPDAPLNNDESTPRNGSPPRDAANPDNDGSTPPSAFPPDSGGPPNQTLDDGVPQQRVSPSNSDHSQDRTSLPSLLSSEASLYDISPNEIDSPENIFSKTLQFDTPVVGENFRSLEKLKKNHHALGAPTISAPSASLRTDLSETLPALGVVSRGAAKGTVAKELMAVDQITSAFDFNNGLKGIGPGPIVTTPDSMKGTELDISQFHNSQASRFDKLGAGIFGRPENGKNEGAQISEVVEELTAKIKTIPADSLTSTQMHAVAGDIATKIPLLKANNDLTASTMGLGVNGNHLNLPTPATEPINILHSTTSSVFVPPISPIPQLEPLPHMSPPLIESLGQSRKSFGLSMDSPPLPTVHPVIELPVSLPPVAPAPVVPPIIKPQPPVALQPPVVSPISPLSQLETLTPLSPPLIESLGQSRKSFGASSVTAPSMDSPPLPAVSPVVEIPVTLSPVAPALVMPPMMKPQSPVAPSALVPPISPLLQLEPLPPMLPPLIESLGSSRKSFTASSVIVPPIDSPPLPAVSPVIALPASLPPVVPPMIKPQAPVVSPISPLPQLETLPPMSPPHIEPLRSSRNSFSASNVIAPSIDSPPLPALPPVIELPVSFPPVVPPMIKPQPPVELQPPVVSPISPLPQLESLPPMSPAPIELLGQSRNSFSASSVIAPSIDSPPLPALPPVIELPVSLPPVVPSMIKPQPPVELQPPVVSPISPLPQLETLPPMSPALIESLGQSSKSFSASSIIAPSIDSPPLPALPPVIELPVSLPPVVPPMIKPQPPVELQPPAVSPISPLPQLETLPPISPALIESLGQSRKSFSASSIIAPSIDSPALPAVPPIIELPVSLPPVASAPVVPPISPLPQIETLPPMVPPLIEPHGSSKKLFTASNVIAPSIDSPPLPAVPPVIELPVSLHPIVSPMIKPQPPVVSPISPLPQLETLPPMSHPLIEPLRSSRTSFTASSVIAPSMDLPRLPAVPPVIELPLSLPPVVPPMTKPQPPVVSPISPLPQFETLPPMLHPLIEPLGASRKSFTASSVIAPSMYSPPLPAVPPVIELPVSLPPVVPPMIKPQPPVVSPISPLPQLETLPPMSHPLIEPLRSSRTSFTASSVIAPSMDLPRLPAVPPVIELPLSLPPVVPPMIKPQPPVVSPISPLPQFETLPPILHPLIEPLGASRKSFTASSVIAPSMYSPPLPAVPPAVELPVALPPLAPAPVVPPMIKPQPPVAPSIVVPPISALPQLETLPPMLHSLIETLGSFRKSFTASSVIAPSMDSPSLPAVPPAPLVPPIIKPPPPVTPPAVPFAVALSSITPLNNLFTASKSLSVRSKPGIHIARKSDPPYGSLADWQSAWRDPLMSRPQMTANTALKPPSPLGFYNSRLPAYKKPVPQAKLGYPAIIPSSDGSLARLPAVFLRPATAVPPTVLNSSLFAPSARPASTQVQRTINAMFPTIARNSYGTMPIGSYLNFLTGYPTMSNKIQPQVPSIFSPSLGSTSYTPNIYNGFASYGPSKAKLFG